MTRTLVVLLLLILTGLMSCNHGHGPGGPNTEMTSAEYGVLVSWIDARFTSKEQVNKGITKIVIFNTTSDDPHIQSQGSGGLVPWKTEAESLRKQEPALLETTTDAFGSNILHQAVLPQSLSCAIECIVVDSARLEPIFKKGGGDWPAYFKQFPGSPGLLTFSRVGFSPDGTQALFYLSANCGGLCGSGYYIVMEKHSGQWVIKKEINVWVS
jgi:hypothetical protein